MKRLKEKNVKKTLFMARGYIIYNNDTSYGMAKD